MNEKLARAKSVLWCSHCRIHRKNLTKLKLFFIVFREKKFVALKVVKSAPHYTETALDEIKLLKCVSVYTERRKTKIEGGQSLPPTGGNIVRQIKKPTRNLCLCFSLLRVIILLQSVGVKLMYCRFTNVRRTLVHICPFAPRCTYSGWHCVFWSFSVCTLLCQWFQI